MWENLKAFDLYPERLEILKAGDVMPDIVLASYREHFSVPVEDRTP